MKRLIEFPREDQPGSTIVLEVDEPEAPGITRAARPDEVAERAGDTFEQAVARVTPAAETLVQHLRKSVSAPEEISVEFESTSALPRGPSSPRQESTPTST